MFIAKKKLLNYPVRYTQYIKDNNVCVSVHNYTPDMSLMNMKSG